MSQEKEFEQLLKRISKNLRTARLKRGLTQEEMVEHGFNYRHYQKLESGTHTPSLNTLFRLSKALNVPLSALITK